MARIESGEWKPGDQLPSFAQLRSEYGASRPTAERILSILDQNGLIERQSGYGCFVAKRLNQRSKNGIVGLCGWGFLDGTGTWYWMRVMEGINAQARQGDSQVLLLDRALGKGWEKVDGMLISRLSDQKVDSFIPPKMPHVRMFYAHQQSVSVSADEDSGIREAVRHLLALGHRRIAYLIGRGPDELTNRVRAYASTLRDVGIEPRKHWRRELSGTNDFSPQFTESGQRDMKAWLADAGANGWKRIDCTAILCHND